ncbi:hypothetical protein DBR36_01510 [Microbacterium sp. HMWF026]|uniref:hypothetical protein n=1 Tax=Microbacterium sp. HMWF026 TaxID=2056861 RepID=UPI000D3B8A8D|nr:hypothetical protein [Microbacterium sp. HMWF026]PTT22612.1 hypothetical protein DBR36_01510 [Microbacterium sp. HMWF026]
MALSIDIAANTRQAQAQVKDLSKDLDKVADSLDDLASEAKTSERATEGVADGLSEMGREGESAGDKLEASFSSMVADAKKAERAAKDVGDAGKNIGDGVKRGTERAKEGMSEFKSEANSTARESAASFDGTGESITDVFQEVAANAFAGFGPAGAAAGLAIAAAFGAMMQSAADAQEKLQEAREAAAELAREMYDNGGTLPLKDRIDELFSTLSKEAKANGALQSMIDQWSDFGTVLEDLEGTADAVNKPVSELIDALSGNDLDQTRAVLEAVNSELDNMSDWTPVWDEQYQSLNGYKTELEATLSAQETAARLNEAVAESGAAAAARRAQAEEEASARIQSATEAVVESSLGAYDSMRNAAYEKATADNQAFDVGKWLTYVEETRAQADAYKANLQNMKLSPGEWENLLSLPEEARAGIAASYASSGEDGKARIRAALGDGGAGEAGSEAAVSFDAAFNPDAEIKPQVDTSAAESKVKELTKDREMKIRVKLDTSEVDAWTPPRKTGTVRVGVDGTAWDRYTPATKIAYVRSQPLGG